LASTKTYAKKQHTSVSILVEGYFRNLTKSTKRKTIIDLVDELPPHNIDSQTDLKESYYKDQSNKYGF
jgi:hypothetical protein